MILGFRRISLCHPWHLAARWWTQGSVWLSDRASPSLQSVHSFPEGPLCIEATSQRWLQLQRHPPPAQTQNSYHVCVNVWPARETCTNTKLQVSAHFGIHSEAKAARSLFLYLGFAESLVSGTSYITWSCLPQITCKGAVIRCKCSCKAYLDFSPTISINTN